MPRADPYVLQVYHESHAAFVIIRHTPERILEEDRGGGTVAEGAGPS